MSDSVIQFEDSELGDDNLVFVRILRDYPVLLDKSQTPTVKTAKKTALEEFTKKVNDNTRKEHTTKTITKKIHNLKALVKSKSDANRAGTVHVIWKGWEVEFLNLLDLDSNLTFTKMPDDSVEIRQPSSSNNQFAILNVDNAEAEELVPPPDKKMKSMNNSLLDKAETDETRKLSTSQLQRLILLEQLKLIRMKKERFSTAQVIHGSFKRI